MEIEFLDKPLLCRHHLETVEDYYYVEEIMAEWSYYLSQQVWEWYANEWFKPLWYYANEWFKPLWHPYSKYMEKLKGGKNGNKTRNN